MIIHKNTLVKIDWLAEAQNRWWKLRRARRKEIMYETAQHNSKREDAWEFNDALQYWFLQERVVRALYTKNGENTTIWSEGNKALDGWQPPLNSY